METRSKVAPYRGNERKTEVVIDGLKKLIGAYLVVVAALVVVFFIINPFLVDSVDVQSIWYVLDVLMVIALALALVFNFARKREECRLDSGGAVTRRYLEAKVTFFVTAGVTILFLHNWFSLLAFGGDSLDGNHQTWLSGRRWIRCCRWSWVSPAAGSGKGNPTLSRHVDSGALEIAGPSGMGAAPCHDHPACHHLVNLGHDPSSHSVRVCCPSFNRGRLCRRIGRRRRFGSVGRRAEHASCRGIHLDA